MWKSLLSIGGPVLTSVLGWLLHGVKTDGSADLIQTAMVALFGAGSAVTVWVTVVQTGWAKGGGKLDGKLDAKEIEGIFDEVLARLGLQSLEQFTDQLAPKLADGLQALTGTLPFQVAMSPGPLGGATATQLVDAVKAWDVDESDDPTANALYGTALDLLSDAVKADAEGSDAAAKMRAAMHRIQFPSKTIKPVAA